MLARKLGSQAKKQKNNKIINLESGQTSFEGSRN